MNCNKYILFLSLILMTSSCNDNSKQITKHSPDYIIQCIQKQWNVSDYFDLNELVCLETNKNCFISRIDKMHITSDRIYILDQEANSVFMFSREGKYISKINSVGKGPGEYLSIVSMDITDDAIYLLAWRAKQSVMKFNLDLSFIDEDFSPITCSALKNVENGVYYYPANSCNKKLYNNGKYHNFAFLNNKMKVDWYDLPYNGSFCGRSNFYGSQGCNFALSSSTELFFTKPFSDYIFKVEKSGLKPYIKLNFGYEGIENAQNKMDRKELLELYKKKKMFKSIGNLCISKNFTYFQIFSDKSFRCIVEGNKAFYTSCSGVDPKIGLNLSSHVGNTSNCDGIIIQVSPTHIKYMCDNQPDLVDRAIKDINNSITKNNNPVLIFLKSKQK